MPKLVEEVADLKGRYCNRCNKELEKNIGVEPRCEKCGCPEFRFKIKTPLRLPSNTSTPYIESN